MTQVTQNSQASPGPNVPLFRRPLLWTWVLIVGLLLLLAAIIWTQWTASQLRKAEVDRLTTEQQTLNAQLEAERARLLAALEDDPCKAREHLRLSPVLPPDLPPLLPEGDQAASPAQGQDSTQEASPAPGNATPPDTQPIQPLPPAQDIKNVSELLEQATLLILAESPKGVGMGSGFFISPQVVFTNSHVVMDPAARVLVVNKATGSLLPGDIIAFDNKNGRDYALIRLQAAPNVRPLALSPTVRRTDRISAWGFPGAVTGGDPKFQALLKGDLTAIPEVVFTEGSVSVVLERKPPLIVHSAVVSQGNSGGPLVNEQGTLLGINTYIKLDDQSYRQSSLAIVASDIIAFLTEQKIPFTLAPQKTENETGQKTAPAAQAAPAKDAQTSPAKEAEAAGSPAPENKDRAKAANSPAPASSGQKE